MSDEQLRVAREARIAELEAERAEALALADIRAGQIEYLRRYPFGPSHLGVIGKAVHHIDGDPRNNDPSNLRIVDLNKHEDEDPA